MTADPLSSLAKAERENLRPGRARFVSPILAFLEKEAFSDAGWVYERKLDGERCLAVSRNGEVRLFSRSEQVLDAAYPELIEGLAKTARIDEYVVDGEIVAFEGNRTSFSRLQARIHIRDPKEALASGVAVYYYLFDLLFAAGRDLRDVSLASRKKALKAAFDFSNPIRFTPHVNERGERALAEACAKGREGIVAKRRDSKYVSARSRDWRKLKCVARQELVIGGWTDPEGERSRFGALLLGYYESGKLRYAGKVGAGFDEETLSRLGDSLESMGRKTSPFEDEVDEDAHFVTPKLVCEVGFTEWTNAGKLRHPRFLGLRNDKDARDVTREDG